MLGQPDSESVSLVFLLVDGLSMMSLASAIEPLRSLNRLAGREAYRWTLASLDGAAIAASNGIVLQACAVESALADSDYLIVCGGLRIQSLAERRYLAVLRNAARRGIAIGSLSTGSYLLARAGLLDGYRCTIHWENRAAFEEEFPRVHCTGKIYEIDRGRLTCSGGTAAMDLMLHLIADAHGLELARRVANQFHHERIRDQSEDQRGGRTEALVHLPAKLRAAIALMQGRLEDPLPLAEIARRVDLSVRQLQRLFLARFGTKPLRYYLQLRIERGRELLLYSDHPVIEIAVATGFKSTSHFTTWYKRVFGQRPSETRRGPRSPPAAESGAGPAAASQSDATRSGT